MKAHIDRLSGDGDDEAVGQTGVVEEGRAIVEDDWVGDNISMKNVRRKEEEENQKGKREEYAQLIPVSCWIA